MPIAKIAVTRRFERAYTKLPRAIKEKAKQHEIIFRANPFDPRLNTHKLHGKDNEAWAFSIVRKFRIKFLFLASDSVLFLDVGTHDIYN